MGDVLGVPVDVLVKAGLTGIVIVVVYCIIWGWLIPARTLTRMESLHKERLEAEKVRGDEWRATAEARDRRNEMLTGQISQLTEVGKTTNALIEGLRQALGSNQRAGGNP